MENVENAAALGLEGMPKADEEFFKMLLAILEMCSHNSLREGRERELAERVAYLSGKVETLERFLSGA